MTSTSARRPPEALLLVIVLLAAVSFAAGCSQTSSIRAKLAPSGGTHTPVSSTSVAPASPTATTTPTGQPSVTPTTGSPAPSATAATPSATPTTPSATPTQLAPAPAVSSSPTAANGPTSLLWLWILLALAVIAVVVLIVLVSQAAGRRSARTRNWRAMAVDTFAKGAALHDAVVAAGLPGPYGSENAAGRWADIQRRADDLTQTLYRLREAAPGEDERARVDDVLAALYALRSATQTGDISPPGGLGAGNLQARLRNFEAALQALREPGLREPG